MSDLIERLEGYTDERDRARAAVLIKMAATALREQEKGEPDKRILRQERDTAYSVLEQCQRDYGKLKSRIAELRAEVIELTTQYHAAVKVSTERQQRIAELDDLRQHFEDKYKEQCQINMRIRGSDE